MSDTIGAKKRRRRSRYRFSDIPDLTHGLPNRLSGVSRHSALPLTPDATAETPRESTLSASNPPALLNCHFDANVRSPSLEVPDMGEVECSGPTSVIPGINSACAGIAEESQPALLREAVMDAHPIAEGHPGDESSTEEQSNEGESEEETSAPDNTDLSCLKSLKVSNWRVLWALLRTNGSHKFTKANYQSVRNFIDVMVQTPTSSWRGDTFAMDFTKFKRVFSLPHFSTLHKHYRRVLMNELVPRSRELLLDLDLSKAGARATPRSEDGAPRCRVQVIMPSEYARADVSTAPVWHQLKSTTLTAHGQRENSSLYTPAISTAECVDIWPIVAARKWFYGPQSALHLDCNGSSASSSAFAETGDVIAATLLNPPSPFSERFERCFVLSDSSLSYVRIRGCILHSWTVHHPRRHEDPGFEDECISRLDQRDKNIVKRLNFVSYTSPSDAVNVFVPDLPVHTNRDPEELDLNIDVASSTGSVRKNAVPQEMAEAVRRRRVAIRERNSQMEAAWRDWIRPILKPGDFITMLRPCTPNEGSLPSDHSPSGPTLLTTTDRSSRLLLVNRFWVENEERSFHIFWVSGSTELESIFSNVSIDDACLRSICSPISGCNPASLILDVCDIGLVSMHGGLRGPANFKPVSSIGTLVTGEEYFVYRFALYWDGFEVQKGKSATGEGFYLICLNLPLDARSSPSAVRVLSLVPPGVKADEILNSIFEDLIEGMTTGFVDYDAEGRKRRIFLDLVAFLGDTPAINSFLDVLGHTSNACCHLCRFVRGSNTLVGSRYAVGHAHGMISHTMRTYFQHSAVRDSGAQPETCRLLGMKARLPSTTKVIYALRDKMFNARGTIPRTNTGQPVVPYFIDPYRACVIAPDQLLTGHFRDCISLALRLLPSNFHRTSCEKFMMGFLQDAALPIQNRLVDHRKKSLFGMSMTELYALSTVADSALSAGCHHASTTGDDSKQLSAKCEQALQLVRSCAELISELWFYPQLKRDGYNSVHRFEKDNGNTNTSRLQSLIRSHLDKVVRICQISDTDFLQLEDRQCPKERKAELSMLVREAFVAIKTVDKPNLHRLQELVHNTLPFFGFIGRIGELVLEKAHQTLKRSIHLSNNKEIQLHAMAAAAFADWQGRLSMLVQSATGGDKSAILGCFRLLAGRQAVAIRQGKIPPTVAAAVVKALGPGQCLATELKAQGQIVISPRAASLTNSVKWSLRRPLRISACSNVLQSEQQKRTLEFLQRAKFGDLGQYEVCFAEAASSSYSNSTPGVLLHQGDILEILVCLPESPSFHFPYVLQPSSSGCVPSWLSRTGPSIWFLQQLVSLKSPAGSTSLYAAVLPCVQIENGGASSDSDQRLPKYKVCVDERISFATLDESIRRVGVLHNCLDNTCRPVPNRITLAHSPNASLENGGSFFALTRSHGYPPRRG